MANNKIDITVVVNGVSTVVEANVNTPLLTVVNKALADTHNTGQPAERWELRDEEGNLYETNRKIEEYNFPEGITLYLTLRLAQAG